MMEDLDFSAFGPTPSKIQRDVFVYLETRPLEWYTADRIAHDLGHDEDDVLSHLTRLIREGRKVRLGLGDPTKQESRNERREVYWVFDPDYKAEPWPEFDLDDYTKTSHHVGMWPCSSAKHSNAALYEKRVFWWVMSIYIWLLIPFVVIIFLAPWITVPIAWVIFLSSCGVWVALGVSIILQADHSSVTSKQWLYLLLVVPVGVILFPILIALALGGGLEGKSLWPFNSSDKNDRNS